MAKKSKLSGAIAPPSMDRDWRAEDDLRTIERAHEVIGDSARMTAVKKCAKKQREALDRIDRLKGKSI